MNIIARIIAARTLAIRSAALLAIALTIAGPAHAKDQDFISPSGNIFCLFSSLEVENGPAVHCEIYDFTATNRPPPGEDCGVDWGGQFDLAQVGRPEMGCYGDTLLTSDPAVLDYGHSISVGAITCRSERSGMNCTNRDGRGFSLSRARQRLF